jgi:hypothetical protein
MALSWQRSLGLVALLLMTGSASAQFPKNDGFQKKEFGKKKGFDKKTFDGDDAQRIASLREEMKTVRAEIDELKEQLRITSKRIDLLLAEKSELLPAPERAEPKRRPSPKGQAAGGFGPVPKFGPEKGGAPFGPKGPPFGGVPFRAGPPNSPQPNEAGALRDLESSVNRLERAIDELRREMRRR